MPGDDSPLDGKSYFDEGTSLWPVFFSCAVFYCPAHAFDFLSDEVLGRTEHVDRVREIRKELGPVRQALSPSG